MFQIVTSSYTDLQDYTYYFVPAPWLSVKLLRLLQNYPPPEDPSIRTRLTDCLETILNKAQVNYLDSIYTCLLFANFVGYKLYYTSFHSHKGGLYSMILAYYHDVLHAHFQHQVLGCHQLTVDTDINQQGLDKDGYIRCDSNHRATMNGSYF